MRIHFIAIGGALMHNLALALHQKGDQVSGSDDEIYEPSYSRLKNAGLLPEKMGWYPENLNQEIDAVILGMHARKNNPELIRAQELGLKIYSYPEYLYLKTKDKIRIVVGGSHGKTTTTSMIMHILKHNSIAFDYAVGAQIEGFDLMVQLSDAPFMVIEGDEYLSSPLDSRPKFLHYQPHVAILTGIAWDHINVFPSFSKYKKQFKKFIKSIQKDGVLIYFQQDENLKKYAEIKGLNTYAYNTPAHTVSEASTSLTSIDGKSHSIQFFGDHNLQNFQAARLACREIGLCDNEIFNAIKSFMGAAKRMQKLLDKAGLLVYRDFAHAPSKLSATIQAAKKQYPNKKLFAFFELHTFSSLNLGFLEEYRNTMQYADEAIVYFSPHTVEMKKLDPIDEMDVFSAFGHSSMEVFTNKEALENKLMKVLDLGDALVLLMSSGNWGGLDLITLINRYQG